jgi:outer membrane protein assembly factor BamA
MLQGSRLFSSLSLAVLLLAALAAVPCAAGDEDEAFISVTSSDFIDWCSDTMCLMPAMDFHYDRVDGASFSLGLQYLNDENLHPRVRAVRGWMSSREASSYEIEFEQPIHSQDSFSFGIRLYDKTSWSREDADGVSDLRNNVCAFFARNDWRDYYRRDGFTLFVDLEATPELEFRLEYRDDDLSSLKTAQSVWSVFRNGEDWRDNPELTTGIQNAATPFEGRMKSYVASVVYDTRNEYAHNGWLGRAFLEFSGGSVGGDYGFRKYVFDVTRLMRLSSSQTLDLTGSWGIGSGTHFPSHKLFYLGGPGTLRGYDFKEFAGKNLLFARAEYGVDLWPNVKTIFFVDSGSAWDSGGNVSGEFKHDFGIGFQADAPNVGNLRVDIARAATSDDADIFVYLDVAF